MTNLSDKPVSKAKLSELAIAPENMRHHIDLDDGIEQLGRTLLTCQISPLLVRKSADWEKNAFQVLDGRRRAMAYQLLIADGHLPDDHPIDIVLCETPEEIAAAAVVNNAQRLETNTADYLLAIHRLSQQFKTIEEIATILGLEVSKTRQMAKLGALDINFLTAYRDKRLDMGSLRKLARIKDPDELKRLSTTAAAGRLSTWDISDSTTSNSIDATGIVPRIIGKDAYIAAGGTIEQDLFEEKPDRMLDASLVFDLWRATIKPVIDALKAKGLTGYIGVSGSGGHGEEFESLPWNWATGIEKAKLDKEREAIAGLCNAATTAAGDHEDGWQDKAIAWALAEYDLYARKAFPLIPAAFVIYGAFNTLALTFFVSGADLAAHQDDQIAETDDDGDVSTKVSEPTEPKLTIPNNITKIDTTGYQHVLHQVVTKRAGQSLALTLADEPEVAFVAQLAAQFAAQFEQCVLGVAPHHYGSADRLLQITVRKLPRLKDAEPTFISPIVERLQVFKDEYREANLHPIEWIRLLQDERKGQLFALITALQVEIIEDKTNSLHTYARAEAAHLADAAGHDIRDHWLPDAEFYKMFSKKQLLGFLKDMGVKTKEHEKLDRDTLAADVAAHGQTARFAPSALDFELADAPDAEDGDDEDEDQVAAQ